MTINTDLDEMKAWQVSFYRGIFNPSIDNVNSACIDVVGSTELSPEDRLTIYRGSILGGITGSLMGIYPVCEKLVGEQFFIQMVAGYLREYPSASPDLGHYGACLGDYLSEFIAVHESAKHLVYLPDTARLEWLWHQAFNASSVEETDNICRPLGDLALVEVEEQGNIIFQLNPSIGIMQSVYPVNQIWQLNQDGVDEQDSVNLAAGGGCFMVHRNIDFDMVISELSKDEFLFLSAIKEKKSFAQVAGLEFHSAVSDLLAISLQSGSIVGFNAKI
jgi:hypothetical protein